MLNEYGDHPLSRQHIADFSSADKYSVNVLRISSKSTTGSELAGQYLAVQYFKTPFRDLSASGFSILLRFPLTTMLTFCTIVRKWDHQKCRCHHLVDTLVEFSQSLVFLTLLKCLNVPYPSMFTNLCMNYYAHVPCREKIAKNPSAY